MDEHDKVSLSLLLSILALAACQVPFLTVAALYVQLHSLWDTTLQKAESLKI